MRGLGGVLFAIMVMACTPDVRIGDRCEYSSECPAPYRCAFGRCRAECRVNVDCPLGAVCRLDTEGIGSCSLADDPGCDGAMDCADGLACVNRACVDRCEGDADCANGNECWSVPSTDVAFCVDPRARPDAGMPVERDAGVGDAGPTDASADGAARDAWIDPDAGGCAGDACGAVIDVVIAHRHACALTLGGSVWCWGDDEVGETSAGVGDLETCGAAPCRTAPTRVELTGTSKAVALAAGAGFTCARKEDGTVDCWGTNSSGALGRTADEPVVGAVDDLAGATSLFAGNGFALAGTSTGIVGWGDNRNGQLQQAPTSGGVPLAPVTSDIGSLAVGGHHACVLRGAVVHCWGLNGFRQLGRTLPGSEVSSALEGPVDGLAGTPERLVAGASRTCVIDDGALTCWGYDVEGDAGPPTAVPYGESIAELWSAPSSLVLCGATSTGDPVCFGRADDDAFWPSGTGNVRAVPTPMHASLPRPVLEITTDGATGCSIGGGGQLWCWGANDLGQLGRGSSGPADRTPAQVIIPAD